MDFSVASVHTKWSCGNGNGTFCLFLMAFRCRCRNNWVLNPITCDVVAVAIAAGPHVNTPTGSRATYLWRKIKISFPLPLPSQCERALSLQKCVFKLNGIKLEQINQVKSKFKNILLHYQKSSLNAIWIEVYEGSRTLDKQSFFIANKFKAVSQIRISDDC